MRLLVPTGETGNMMIKHREHAGFPWKIRRNTSSPEDWTKNLPFSQSLQLCQRWESQVGIIPVTPVQFPSSQWRVSSFWSFRVEPTNTPGGTLGRLDPFHNLHGTRFSSHGFPKQHCATVGAENRLPIGQCAINHLIRFYDAKKTRILILMFFSLEWEFPEGLEKPALWSMCLSCGQV